MGTFGFDKEVEQIEEPTLMLEDWYVARVVEEPKKLPNKKKMAKLSYKEGAGDNLVIKLAVEHPQAEFNGRRFTLWLPFPDKEDLNHYDSRGMRVYDAKLERIASFSRACGHVASGSTLDINAGDKLKIYVNVSLDQTGQKMVNNLDSFGGFQPVDWVADVPAGEEVPGDFNF